MHAWLHARLLLTACRQAWIEEEASLQRSLISFILLRSRKSKKSGKRGLKCFAYALRAAFCQEAVSQAEVSEEDHPPEQGFSREAQGQRGCCFLSLSVVRVVMSRTRKARKRMKERRKRRR